MKTNLSELVFILDKSGSMSGLESDTIGGYNAMLKKQQQQPGEAIVTAESFGISADRAANYNADGEGTKLNYQAVSNVVSEIRASRPIKESWKAQIDEDFARRGK